MAKPTAQKTGSVRRALAFVQRNGAALTLVGTAVGALVGWSLPVFHDYYAFKTEQLRVQADKDIAEATRQERDKSMTNFAKTAAVQLDQIDQSLLEITCELLEALKRQVIYIDDYEPPLVAAADQAGEIGGNLNLLQSKIMERLDGYDGADGTELRANVTRLLNRANKLRASIRSVLPGSSIVAGPLSSTAVDGLSGTVATIAAGSIVSGRKCD
jgi:hypothetical protein